ncbi:hypothetical protein HDU76_004800 [Blyttiomyces sp. JEL0837]|nr:hypothetical protein HDU76_004800 [Blyttiomyces sp. JEL0837]
MVYASALVAALALLPSALAFSNGTLIPGYICNLKDLAMGSPASLGQVIPLFQEDEAMGIIAGYHHKDAAPYVAQDLCGAKTVNNAAIGATTDFLVTVKNPNEILVGLIVWIQDFPHGPTGLPRRIGKFTKAVKNMAPYPWHGCGTPGSTLVHTTALNDDLMVPTQSDPLTWMAPKEGIQGGFVQVRGVCITESKTEGGMGGGFGKFAIDINVNGMVTNGGNNAMTSATKAVSTNGVYGASMTAKTSTYGVATTTYGAATTKSTMMQSKSTNGYNTMSASMTAKNGTTNILYNGAEKASAGIFMTVLAAAAGVVALF